MGPLKLLKKQKHITPVQPREEQIRATIACCRELFCRQEQCRTLDYWEFMVSQFSLIRKRWWLLQGLILGVAAWALPQMEADHIRVRCVGVVGCAFAVLAIPELWRNKSSASTQVEASCLYSLRQVYAARITILGLVDFFLAVIFSVVLRRGLKMTGLEVIAQFLLPVTVTACLCLRMLCARHNLGEPFALVSSMLWTAGWCLVVGSEEVYSRILPAAWIVIFLLSVLVLTLAVRRAVRTTNQYWEVTDCEIAAG